MNPFSLDDALALARGVVARCGADETEVTVRSIGDCFVRFAAQGPTQSADRERVEVAVRVRVADAAGVREARAECGSLDDASADAAAARAMALARVSSPTPDVAALGGAVDVVETAPERPTIDHSFREKARAVELALEACRAAQLLPAGLFQTTTVAETLVNSSGREVCGARSRASFALTASTPDERGVPSGEGSGQAQAISTNVERIDPAAVIERACETAVASRDPRPIEAGEYTVVLEPAAVSSLLLFAAYQGFGAQEVAERSSFLCGRVGEVLFPEQLVLYDDASNDFYPGLPFDGEGAPRRRTPLLVGGALQPPVTDARWALELGRENTGHAAPQPSIEGPSPKNLVLAAGSESTEELIQGVERGLLIKQFHYTNVIEPLELTLTGMTRNGTFWIEGGEARHPVKNLRFTQSLVQALGAVTGIGRDPEVAGALFDGEIVCPALRIDGFRFTSTTAF